MNLCNKVRGRPTKALKSILNHINKDKFISISKEVMNKVKRELNIEKVIIEENQFEMAFGLKLK